MASRGINQIAKFNALKFASAVLANTHGIGELLEGYEEAEERDQLEEQLIIELGKIVKKLSGEAEKMPLSKKLLNLVDSANENYGSSGIRDENNEPLF